MASLKGGSFFERAAQMSSSVENWDDDADFHGDLFAQSLSSHTGLSLSSRAPSLRSDSAAGEEDWQVLLAPGDESSTKDAISSAKHAGIPIPNSVPSSALLGGTIKRLGKQPSRQKIHANDDDWADDLELPGPSSGTLKLKTLQPPATPKQDDDDFDDWAEGGSLGIRFGGTRRDTRTRGSSVVSAAMSPSMGSCMTLESEDDDFGGLVLPKEPIDFGAMLRQRKDSESDDEKTPQPEPRPPQERDVTHDQPEEQERSTDAAPVEETAPHPDVEAQPDALAHSFEPEPPFAPHPAPHQPAMPLATLKAVSDEDDFFAGIEMGPGEGLDTGKLTVNRNIKVQSSKPAVPAARPTTTLTFTDKPSVSSTSRIPRPLAPAAPRSRLEPLYESGASHPNRHGRAGPTTTSAQLLRAKRSAPVLRSDYRPSTKPPSKPLPFLSAGVSNRQSHHLTSKSSQPNLRRDSDPRANSPTPRTYSRLGRQGETPSRSGNRKDFAPASLAREAATKRMFTKPARKRNFGDGSELDAFDDLPTSSTKENKYVKQPSNRQPSKMIRQVSHSKLPVAPERIESPQPPPTPKRTLRRENTPSFARDTASSRIAREQRLGGPKPRSDSGPLMPINPNWKAQVAARSPQTSPQANRKRASGQKPYLIKQMNTPAVKNEKGMTYNPVLQRWEGNEAALARFSASAVQDAKRPRITSHHSHSHSQPQPQTTSNHQHSRSTPTLPAPASAPNVGSPPRPALISHISSSRGVQVEKGMVFDPRKMCWLKLDPRATGPLSPAASIGEDSDPFADIEDLKDENDSGTGGGGYFSLAGGPSIAQTPMDTFVNEEFDLGPGFIKRQREEEDIWRRRVEGWVGERRESLGSDWRWAIRDLSIEMAEHLPR